MLDLAIVNGTVVDGSGTEPMALDVGVMDGKIAEIVAPGHLSPAAKQIDAAGKIVTPGFVDPHTHMDAQLWWDPSGSPSALHGVTSIVLSSCGFGVAPLRAGTEEYVLRSLESVEEIPYAVTRQALPMSWRSWGDYFNLLGELPLGVNVAGFVPHSALRAAVLGPERRSQPATPAERHRLTDALREALDEGAIGFSTSRGTNHTDATGSAVPSRFADDDELTALLSAGGDRIWQMNIRSKGDATEAGLRNALDELDRYASMTRQADWRLTWTPLVAGPGDTHVWRRLLESSEQHTDVAAPQTSPQPIQSAITFDGPSYAAMVDGWAPAFAGYGDLSDSDRMARLADRDFRDILKASPQNCARITAPCFDRWRVGSSTDADAIGLTLSQYAEQIDSDPVDAMLDLAIGDGLTTVIEAPLSNIDEEAVRALVTAPHTLFGIGDAGAHIKSITNYTYPTYVLARLTRDEAWFTIAEAVSELTRRPAEMFAFAGRGLLAPGYAADVCVIDLERLAVGPARVVADMPGGGKRLHRDATGYSAVVVNGTVTVENDQLTGASAGRLVRA